MSKAPGARPNTLPDEAERYRLLAEMAEQSTDMISRHLPGNWEFIYASPAVTHLLGYSVDEIIGMSAYDLYHPSDVENFKRRAPSVSYERGLYTHTYRFRRNDGSYTWLESTSRSIRDAATGELKEILVVSRDASQRINAEKANRRLARVLEKSSDLVIFANPDGRITYVNEAARSTLGLSSLGRETQLLRSLFSEASYHLLESTAIPVSSDAGNWSGQAVMIGANDSTLPVSLEMLAHRSLDGAVEYFSIMAKDMRAAKEAELQMHKISQASRLITMGELASGLAHELNQPLTAIVNYIRGIERRLQQNPSLPLAEYRQPLESIARTAHRASAIVRKTMDFSRRRDPQRQPLSLPEVFKELIEFCKTLANWENIEITASIPDDLPPVLADRIQVEQILLNLIMNAVEATESVGTGDSLKTVTVRAAEYTSHQILISVTDQGCGIERSNKDSIFDQFFTTKPAGLGMGLAISRSLVEAHGGQIWVEESPQGGAVFKFTLGKLMESTNQGCMDEQ